MLTQFTNVFAEEGINIAHMTNKSRGDYSYCVFDIDAASSKALEDKLNAIDGVLKVRIINNVVRYTICRIVTLKILG